MNNVETTNEDSVIDTTEVTPSIPASNMENLLSEASRITSLIKEAKTSAKRDLYKRKMKKLQKEVQIALYSQYIQNKVMK